VKKDLLENALDIAMQKALADPNIRLLLWHIVYDRLYVFEPGYNHNATAYSLLAKKEAGLQLLAWMKSVDPDMVNLAESEYNTLLKSGGNEDGGTD